jgi:hypothetical protein
MATELQMQQACNAIPDKRTAKQIRAILANKYVNNRVATACDVTATLTAAAIAGGVITSTSAAAVAATLPTATAIASLIGASRGTMIEFAVDNSAGANTVTVTVGSGITAPAGAVTGGNTLTVTTTHKVGLFQLYFTSATAAVIYRLA